MKNKKNKNTYFVAFSAKCPTNGMLIEYLLTVSVREPIRVEALLKVVGKCREGFHEDFADLLHQEFGGAQVLTAIHHGVAIKSRRA